MISPLRKPIANTSTATTITIASTRLITNPLIAVVTASDWIEIRPNSIPIGVSDFSARNRAARALPMSTTFPPATVETPSPIAR